MMKLSRQRIPWAAFAASAFLGTLCYAAAPAHLRCENVTGPLGIDRAQPRLSWVMQSDERGAFQRAYRVLVASTSQALSADKGDLWDSGKVRSGSSVQIAYGGFPLESSQRVFWKVRIWDQNDRASPWSSAETWRMGLLQPDDWKGRWITGPANGSSLLFRREFTVKSGLRRAIVHISGLGQYELSANGQKVGDDLLAPGWSEYRKTCLYDTLDVTSQLHAGRNAVGILLGNGMYHIAPDEVRYVKFTQSFGPLKVIAHIRLDYASGASEIIATDSSWHAGPSPVTFNNVFAGEDFDARLVQPGWDQAGFRADEKWTAAVATSGPGGVLRGLSYAAPPIRAIEVLTPAAANPLSPNVTVYDFGQNASIMPRIVIRGDAGTIVRVIPSELLKPDGTVDRTSATQDGVRPAWWQYTLKGDGRESWFPKFFYSGSRYLQVERFAAQEGGPLPRLERIEAVVAHSSSTPVGEFTCSNPLFNRIYRLVRWAQRSNMVSLMTDCPHREKLGWLEQTHLNGPSLRYNFDLAQLFTKSMNDMADSQLENGFVPNIAPEYFVAGEATLTNPMRNSPEWGGAFVMVAWQQYLFNGDIELLRRHYEGMKRYVAFLDSTASNHIVETGLGDWCDIGPKKSWASQLTPGRLTATAFYQHFNWILARFAEVLGKPEEARELDRRAEQIRSAFNHQFFDSTQYQYSTGSQCANAIPLVMNLVEPTNRASVLDALITDVRKRDNGLTTGDVGYRYLLRALADSGHSDVVFAMNNQSDKPGYGYQLEHGATSLTEKWDASITDGFGSQNHFMLGQINEWFFHDLAGIQCDPAGPGFKKILIKPAVVGDLREVRAAFYSVHGRIVSEWRREGKTISLRVVIPANTTATVHVPTADARAVRESGRPALRAPGVRFLGTDAGDASYQVQSGEYMFEAILPAGGSR